ncbi:MAG: 4Fe-4S dicluster domain-containing protein [Syntrophales bacterium]
MKQTIVFRPERCLLCLSCVLACQMKAPGAHDPRDLASGQQPPRRISMDLVEGTPRASVCRHCVQAPCVEACISGSMVRDEESSTVRHRPETCVGCGTCQLVCPFNAVTRNDREDRMEKCNLCPEEETPPCVSACQTGALTLGSSDRGAQEKKRRFAEELRGGVNHG